VCLHRARPVRKHVNLVGRRIAPAECKTWQKQRGRAVIRLFKQSAQTTNGAIAKVYSPHRFCRWRNVEPAQNREDRERCNGARLDNLNDLQVQNTVRHCWSDPLRAEEALQTQGPFPVIFKLACYSKAVFKTTLCTRTLKSKNGDQSEVS
jgi:hypothetical protein